ncbi:MFS multidrug transporter [Rhexocercosporidium sp. MPI-PUGE-AT-0058]|nr:MFS multidrug transporter [Rhexocercosporidium sp. MPI-PUGE-AT-0058]
MVAVIVFIVNLSTTISAPASGNLHNQHLPTGLYSWPLVMAPLSELYGRLIVYHLSIATFVAFLLACGWSQSIVSFLILHFNAGCAASSPSTIGGGTVADLIPVQERGAAMAITALGPILAPVIGPVAGGFITQKLSWRWTFWIAGTWLVVAVIFMRETYAPVLLERKAARFRKTTGNEELQLKGRGDSSPLAYLGRGLSRPLKLLVLSPVVLLLSIYVAFVFGLMFLCFSTYSAVFIDQYHFSVGVSGLTYLGQGTGMVIGLGLKAKGEMTPEERLPLMEKVQWMAPICATSFIGLGNLFVMLPAQIYLVDAFGSGMAASALAANSLLGSLFGTFLPLAAPKLYSLWATHFGLLTLGYGWVPVLFYKYGAYLRNRFQVQF